MHDRQAAAADSRRLIQQSTIRNTWAKASGSFVGAIDEHLVELNARLLEARILENLRDELTLSPMRSGHRGPRVADPRLASLAEALGAKLEAVRAWLRANDPGIPEGDRGRGPFGQRSMSPEDRDRIYKLGAKRPAS